MSSKLLFLKNHFRSLQILCKVTCIRLRPFEVLQPRNVIYTLMKVAMHWLIFPFIFCTTISTLNLCYLKFEKKSFKLRHFSPEKLLKKFHLQILFYACQIIVWIEKKISRSIRSKKKLTAKLG